MPDKGRAAAQLPLRLKISGPYGAGYADVPARQKRAFTSRAMAFENLPEAGAAARNWKYDIRAITADLGGGRTDGARRWPKERFSCSSVI